MPDTTTSRTGEVEVSNALKCVGVYSGVSAICCKKKSKLLCVENNSLQCCVWRLCSQRIFSVLGAMRKDTHIRHSSPRHMHKSKQLCYENSTRVLGPEVSQRVVISPTWKTCSWSSRSWRISAPPQKVRELPRKLDFSSWAGRCSQKRRWKWKSRDITDQNMFTTIVQNTEN